MKIDASLLKDAGIPFRTETDGSLIADCPICELENKGKDKLKIFPDGTPACFRFAGTGAGEHIKEIQAEVKRRVQGSNGKKAFMSEVLLDGKLTIEIEPAGNKQRVVARNCKNVLHSERFNLSESVGRAKFVSVLNLPDADARTCIQTLIDLEDRFHRVQEAIPDKETEVVPTPVSFVVLSDGRRAELTTQGFAVYDPQTKETAYEKQLVDDDGTVYVPSINAARAHSIGLFLPSGVAEYFTDEQLDADILKFIEKYVDITDQDRAICAKYPRVTYRTESLQEIPYLRAVGESGAGKSRLAQTVGLLCHRPIFSISISAPALFRTVDAFKPTLILDEFNIDVSSDDTAALLQVLNAGFSRIYRVLRCSSDKANFAPEGFDPFGAKILAGLSYTKSPAFESRTHPVRLEETTRNDIPLQLLPEMLEEAESIRNKLTLWRLRTYDVSIADKLKEAEQALKDAGDIRKRLIQIAIPIYALLDSKEVKKNFVAQLQQRTKDAADERSQNLEGELVRVIYYRLFEETDEGDWQYVDYDKELIRGQEGKPDERLTIAAITDEINSGLPDKRKHTTAFIGKVTGISGNLHLKSDCIKRRQSPNYQKRAILFNQKRLCNLFKIYNLPVPPFFCCTHCTQ